MSIDDLKNKRIGVLPGPIHFTYAAKNYPNSKTKKIGPNSENTTKIANY